MIKTYKLTQALRNSSFVLRGKTGNAQRFNFSGGDPLTGKPATLMLRSQYSQDLLEQSEMFKRGYVKLERVDNGGETTPEGNASGTQVQRVEEVDSPEKLLEWVATELEKPYQQPKAALAYAEKQGYTFPNLTIE
jgi:hypothetical protein